MVQAYIAGDACCFCNFQAVADLLDPARYIRTWPMVPAKEITASAVELQMPTGKKNKANNQTQPFEYQKFATGSVEMDITSTPSKDVHNLLSTPREATRLNIRHTAVMVDSSERFRIDTFSRKHCARH